MSEPAPVVPELHRHLAYSLRIHESNGNRLLEAAAEPAEQPLAK